MERFRNISAEEAQELFYIMKTWIENFEAGNKQPEFSFKTKDIENVVMNTPYQFINTLKRMYFIDEVEE